MLGFFAIKLETFATPHPPAKHLPIKAGFCATKRFDNIYVTFKEKIQNYKE